MVIFSADKTKAQQNNTPAPPKSTPQLACTHPLSRIVVFGLLSSFSGLQSVAKPFATCLYFPYLTLPVPRHGCFSTPITIPWTLNAGKAFLPLDAWRTDWKHTPEERRSSLFPNWANILIGDIIGVMIHVETITFPSS